MRHVKTLMRVLIVAGLAWLLMHPERVVAFFGRIAAAVRGGDRG